MGTWNVNGSFSRRDIELWLQTDRPEPYSLYVVGLQEMVPLNPLTVLFDLHVKTAEQKWIDGITSILQAKYTCVVLVRLSHFQNFNCVASQALVGISLFVFAPANSKHSFSAIQGVVYSLCVTTSLLNPNRLLWPSGQQGWSGHSSSRRPNPSLYRVLPPGSP